MGGEVVAVLAGGVALGAYQLGAIAAMPAELRDRLSWIAGSSIGAVNGAIIAGNSPERRVAALEAFWEGVGQPELGWPSFGEAFRQAESWISVLAARALGRPGVFAPRPGSAVFGGLGVYSLAPLERALMRHVDFDRLNGGAVRLTVLATDLADGSPVVFDTAKGDRIGPEHLAASCGFVPDFAPTAIGGRLLGDGAFAANAPVELVLAEPWGDRDLLCLLLDVFAPEAGPPRSLIESAGRRVDLLLAGPTRRSLEGLEREDALRRRLAKAADRLRATAPGDPLLPELDREARRGATVLVHLRYRPGRDEAGPEKQFDFSQASLRRRRGAGEEDIRRALAPIGDVLSGRASGFSILRAGP